MTNPNDFDDDDFDFEDEETFQVKRVSQMTEGEKLQRFKRYFDSSSRALLQQCLFRITEDEDGKGTLEILCPNEVIRQRLYRKKRKITNSLNGCWSHIRWFSLCLEEDGKVCCHKYTRNGDLVTPDNNS
ncbi:hypothetical protein PN465_10630 [Nodularia spumigena CS-584]|jgi:hypothetical protein|uniref:Uncharacterized protein n=2 Tax=Nodularia spumigena TaxID=70799 RepID=A0A161XRE6_NODSP|nr:MULTISPECIES: hypothetical protein [Cyanophyceae]MDB9358651.1 hypothetical protein [Nodularia spumigena CS-587/03]AHJ29541.1 hypothetical protein NSP_32150 [Nodularia spumigena CCY9414]EAW43150.1 hypothetical protein N9414_12953 [Nodularia spumigena CCY9414]KZL51634.1 hypothetical protein A2T98_01230 [Nodularia spumigena CENA596]MDB9302818.1 hypothetical protein [Nodularia spumigena CS-591/12]